MDFESIYQLYFKDVFLFLRSISVNEDIAEEITQETFTKALKAIDTFDGNKDIRAWLFTIAKNTYYTYCKRQISIIADCKRCCYCHSSRIDWLRLWKKRGIVRNCFLYFPGKQILSNPTVSCSIYTGH